MQRNKEEIIAHEFSLMLYRVCREFKKCNPSAKGIELIEQSEALIRQHSNPLHALRNAQATATVGKLITEAMTLHELNPSIVEKEIKLYKGLLVQLMNDEFYINSVPIVLFANLLISLHISFKDVEPLMLPTFEVIKAKETPETLRKKSPHAVLWENYEATLKYTKRLGELMSETTLKNNL